MRVLGNWKPHTLMGGTLINDVAGLVNHLAILLPFKDHLKPHLNFALVQQQKIKLKQENKGFMCGTLQGSRRHDLWNWTDLILKSTSLGTFACFESLCK